MKIKRFLSTDSQGEPTVSARIDAEPGEKPTEDQLDILASIAAEPNSSLTMIAPGVYLMMKRPMD